MCGLNLFDIADAISLCAPPIKVLPISQIVAKQIHTFNYPNMLTGKTAPMHLPQPKQLPETMQLHAVICRVHLHVTIITILIFACTYLHCSQQPTLLNEIDDWMEFGDICMLMFLYNKWWKWCTIWCNTSWFEFDCHFTIKGNQSKLWDASGIFLAMARELHSLPACASKLLFLLSIASSKLPHFIAIPISQIIAISDRSIHACSVRDVIVFAKGTEPISSQKHSSWLSRGGF